MLTPDADNLTGFLVASRSAYNAFVPYHNFRHVVDVLQAIFHFLVRLGRLPPYPNLATQQQLPSSPIAALIRPFDALTLLITAIGHDVGHPGVNNAFLVTLNAPLAQLYNDRSVLESFHCAAYSQILRRHWPAAFHGVEMRQLMISSILATDMGLHFDYMKRMGFLQEKLHHDGGTDGWNGRLLEEQRTLACSLLIKCADISNVVCNPSVTAVLADSIGSKVRHCRSMDHHTHRRIRTPSFHGTRPRYSIRTLRPTGTGDCRAWQIAAWVHEHVCHSIIPRRYRCYAWDGILCRRIAGQ